MEIKKGWKPIPLPLKIILFIFILWSIGSIFAIPTRSQSGLPLLGIFVYGMVASLVVIALDIIAPLTFVFGLWNRKSWAPIFALSYISIFIINSIIAFFTLRQELGVIQIIIPTLANIIFFIVIYKKMNYFR